MSAEEAPGTSSEHTTNAALPAIGDDQDVTSTIAAWNVTTVMTALPKGAIVGVLRNAVQNLELDTAGKNADTLTKEEATLCLLTWIQTPSVQAPPVAPPAPRVQ